MKFSRCKMWGAGLIGVWILSLGLTGGGCANKNARRHYDYVSQPHSYPAVRYCARGRVVDDALNAIDFKYESGWLMPGNLLQGLVLTGFFSMYSVVVELPVSAIVDTALLPYDWHRLREGNAGIKAYHMALLGDHWPVEDDYFDKHYVVLGSERAIDDFVAKGEDVAHAREKTERLIDAGYGLESLARSPLLTVDLAEKLIDKGSEWPVWTVDSQLDRVLDYRAFQQSGRTIGGIPDYMRWSFADFLRMQVILNEQVNPDVLIAVAHASQPPAREHLLHLMTGVNYPPETFRTLFTKAPADLRAKAASNTNAPPETLSFLAGHRGSDLAAELAMSSNPRTERSILASLARSDDIAVLEALAKNPALDGELLHQLALRCDDPEMRPLARVVAGHQHADERTLSWLVDLQDAATGEVIVQRYEIPVEFLDRLVDAVDSGSEEGLRLGRAIIRHPGVMPATLDRLARNHPRKLGATVVSVPATSAQTLAFLTPYATEDSWIGADIARHANVSLSMLRQLAGMNDREINEQLTRNKNTPPDLLGPLSLQALEILTRPVNVDTYYALTQAVRVAEHPNLTAEMIETWMPLLARSYDIRDRLHLWDCLLNHPVFPVSALPELERQLQSVESNRSAARQHRDRISQLRAKGKLIEQTL